MNGDFWGFSYCLSFFFCIKCGGARKVTYINAESIMESSGTFRKLPWRSLASLGFTLVARTRLGHDLGVRPGRVLDLTKYPRFCIRYKKWASQYWIYLHRLGRYLNWVQYLSYYNKSKYSLSIRSTTKRTHTPC